MELAEKFKQIATVSKLAIRYCTDFAQDRVISRAYDEIARLTVAVESLTAEKEAAERTIGGLHEELAAMYEKYSGKQYHENTCAISLAPAERPGPCNCAAPYADNNGLVRQLRRMGDFTEASMISLGWEAAKVIETAESSLAQARKEIERLKEHLDSVLVADKWKYGEINRLENALKAAEQCEKGLKEIIFDGNSVYEELEPLAKKRTSAVNVSDTLDAVARLFRKAALAAASKEEATHEAIISARLECTRWTCGIHPDDPCPPDCDGSQDTQFKARASKEGKR